MPLELQLVLQDALVQQLFLLKIQVEVMLLMLKELVQPGFKPQQIAIGAFGNEKIENVN